MIFHQISVSPNNTDGEQDKEIEDVEMINTNTVTNNKKHKDIMSIGNISKHFRLLEAHGITMIPMDDESSIVENAVESGRTVVLTGSSSKYFKKKTFQCIYNIFLMLIIYDYRSWKTCFKFDERFAN